MAKIKSVFISTFLLLSSYLSFAQAWQQVADFPGVERDDAVSFILGNKAYCGTGLKTGWTPCSDFYSFNLSSESWDTIAALPLGNQRQYASAFSSNGLGYVFGGIASFPLADLWQYNATTNTWNQKSSKPGNGTSGAACFEINGKAFFIGGNNGTTYTSEVWMYDVSSDSWQQKNNFPGNGIWRASAASKNGYGYLLFGKDNAQNYSAILYEYNPVTDTWLIKSNFPERGRTYASMQTFENNLLVFGGIDSLNVYYGNLWYYRLSSGTWQQQLAIPAQGRKGGMSFCDSTHFYYTTGIDNQDNRLKETWKITSPIAVKELAEKKNIKVFPTSCSDYFYVQSTSKTDLDASIFNSYGQVLKQIKFQNETQMVDVSTFNNGLYLLKIKNKEEVTVYKIQVEH